MHVRRLCDRFIRDVIRYHCNKCSYQTFRTFCFPSRQSKNHFYPQLFHSKRGSHKKVECMPQKQLPMSLLLSSTIVTWAHFPYISITAYTLLGMLVAAGPWSMALTKKCKTPFEVRRTPTRSASPEVKTTSTCRTGAAYVPTTQPSKLQQACRNLLPLQDKGKSKIQTCIRQSKRTVFCPARIKFVLTQLIQISSVFFNCGVTIFEDRAS